MTDQTWQCNIYTWAAKIAGHPSDINERDIEKGWFISPRGSNYLQIGQANSVYVTLHGRPRASLYGYTLSASLWTQRFIQTESCPNF